MTVEPIETEVLLRGQLVGSVAAAPDSVDLIYLDPPSFSNRQYEVIWCDEAEVRVLRGSLGRRSQPDVVLMDVRMPRLDGVEATRASSPPAADPGS